MLQQVVLSDTLTSFRRAVTGIMNFNKRIGMQQNMLLPDKEF